MLLNTPEPRSHLVLDKRAAFETCSGWLGGVVAGGECVEGDVAAVAGKRPVVAQGSFLSEPEAAEESSHRLVLDVCVALESNRVVLEHLWDELAQHLGT